MTARRRRVRGVEYAVATNAADEDAMASQTEAPPWDCTFMSAEQAGELLDDDVVVYTREVGPWRAMSRTPRPAST